MNVENSANRNATAASNRADGTQGRARAKADDASPDAGALSFLSLLTELAAPLPSDGPVVAVSQDQDRRGDSFDEQLGIVGREQDPALPPMDLQGSTEAALAGIAVPDPVLPATAPVALAGSRSGTAIGGPAGAAGESGATDASALSTSWSDDTVLQLGAAHAKGAASANGAASAAAGTVPLTGLQDDGTGGSPRDFMARVQAARLAIDADTVMATRSGAAASSLSGGLQPITSLFDRAAAGMHDSPWRGPERSGQRFGRLLEATGAGSGVESAVSGTSHGASPVYAPGATTPVPAAAVADKVHYWMSRGVQNAQLQLDAFDGGSVEVSISVKGQEALVEFRTDQAQARRLLMDAMPQLKQMLEDEGMMLSGGFVGQSAPRDSGSQGQQGQQQGGRNGYVRSAAPASEAPPQSRTPGQPGSAIDLFV